ncbi:MAG TPA: cellulase family glycosylhydrolase [Fibrobacteria bacterium]|nr:cellulase family glycosylhydrolase [Fibrobacteria bacterium]
MRSSRLAFPPCFQVDGRFLTSPDGQRVVLRGINEMFVLGDRDGRTLEEISRTGANCVRLVWTLADGNSAELDALIERCLALGMLPIPEFHDATGKWDLLESVVDGWLQSDYLEVVLRHQPNLVVNIANEAGQEVSARDFLDAYAKAIQRLRQAGIRCPLMIDAAGWGQDYELLSRTGAALVESDPLRNVLLSIHLWWPAKNSGGTAESASRRVALALADAQEKNLPLVVGEFGAAFTEDGHVWEADRIAWETILEECQTREIGWLAWSWGGVPNQPQTDLDMTRDGTFDSLHGWGREVAMDHPLSITRTARPIEWLRKHGA